MKRLNVLLIEDNLADIELVREALELAELKPVFQIATDCEQARRYIEDIQLGADEPDIVLLDLNLPKGSGLELLKTLRTSPKFKSVPVIVVSSSGAARDRDSATQFGAAHYFRKPTDLDEFMKLGQIVIELVAHTQV